MAVRPWFYDDVRFDDADAQAAIAALRRVRARVDALGEARASASVRARHDWAGRLRDDFDREFTTSQRALASASERVATVIGRIGDAAESADLERSRRAAMRSNHERDLAAQRNHAAWFAR